MEHPTPRSNPLLFGHETAEQTLHDTFLGPRFHHAWLITGPKGIGKATLAYRFARFLLAQGRQVARNDGNQEMLFGAPTDPLPDQKGLFLDPDDPLFIRVAESGHGDLLTVTRTANDRGVLRNEIGVDDVRPMNDFLSMTPAEGGWRVVVVDAADEMTINAANGLLKLLEEPPRRVVILLVCHRVGRLLPTVISRCRRLPLRPLPEDGIVQVLAHCRPELAEEDARQLALLAEGSPGRAIELAELGGLEFHGLVMDMLESLPNPNPEALNTFVERLARPGEGAGFQMVTGFLRWWIDRLVLYGATCPADASPTRERAVMDRLLQRSSLDHWLQVRERVERLIRQAAGGTNLDRKQVLLSVFLNLS